jgi:hypothetical protein
MEVGMLDKFQNKQTRKETALNGLSVGKNNITNCA